MSPLVSVIIPALNEEKNLARCLNKVFQQETDLAFEVLVVDSGSRDMTKDIARAFAKNHPLRILEVTPAEFSHGRTRQFASEQAQGDYLVYLVADAEPANNQWLSKLIAAAQADEAIAGAYSRQVSRPGASVMEKLRLSRRPVSKSEPRLSELARSEDYWLLEPMARIFICDFDDVSSVRKRAVLEQIPIPDCDWAEDLVWAKACLNAGYKIAFAPESRVVHSHRLSAGYLFRRGWIDQKAAAENFGLVYYPDFQNAARGFFLGTRNEIAEIMDANASRLAKISSGLRTPAWVGAEIAGRFLAQAPAVNEASLELMSRLDPQGIHPRNASERVAKTAFTIGDQWRKALLANPPAVIDFQIDAAEDTEFRFGIGIKPEAFKFRTAPIEFSVAINDAEVFKQSIEISSASLKGWKDFSIELNQWRGARIKLSLLTDSSDMKHGWAAWAEPRIVYKNWKPRTGLKTRLAALAQAAVSGNFRHD